LRFEIVDSHQAARRLDLKTLPSDSSSELLFLHLLATTPPRQQFAAENFRHDYRISQLRYGLIGLSIVALLGGALFAAKQLYGAYSLQQEAQALTASEADLSWRYREISATFPQLGIDNDTLRRVTNRQSELLKQQRTPDEAYRLISRAMSEMPNVHLEALDWKLGGSTPPGTAAARDTIGDLLKSDSEVITLRGTIRLGPTSTARQTLATFEHFIDLLRVDRDSDVSVLQQPFEIESGRALRGGDVDNESTQPRQFTVQIARKLPS
jgi:hypothetical protein